MTKEIKLFNTLGRQLMDFVPIETGKVRLYACGLTVYNYAHIGNLRTYIFEDVLRRTLEYLDYEVKHVMNVTDVGHLTLDADSGASPPTITAISAWERTIVANCRRWRAHAPPGRRFGTAI